MRAVGRSLLLHRPLDVERGLQLLCDEFRVRLDLKGLHRPRGLELVDEDHPLPTHPETVERALLQVRLEGSSDPAPHTLPVGPTLLLITDGHRVGVLTQQARSGVPNGPLTDRLDLQQGVLLDRHLGPEIEVAVRGAEDVVLRK